MKKRIISLLCAVLMLTAVCVPAFAAERTQAPAVSTYATVPAKDSISFTGRSGTQYYVNFLVDKVGYNCQFTTGDKVKVCQAYCYITGCNPGDIDGIWGQHSDIALRAAQTKLSQKYPVVTSDGVCGINTWRGFWGYHGGTRFTVDPPSSLKTLL